MSHWPSQLHYLEDAVQPPQRHEPAERRAETKRDVDASGEGEAWQVTWQMTWQVTWQRQAVAQRKEESSAYAVREKIDSRGCSNKDNNNKDKDKAAAVEG